MKSEGEGRQAIGCAADSGVDIFPPEPLGTLWILTVSVRRRSNASADSMWISRPGGTRNAVHSSGEGEHRLERGGDFDVDIYSPAPLGKLWILTVRVNL
ncbi:hypothetical protein G3N57_17140 [Paraburkholderia sp. Se-20369]|nr:hypothetical protein [Paraburkholderia sp. Se-20369]